MILKFPLRKPKKKPQKTLEEASRVDSRNEEILYRFFFLLSSNFGLMLKDDDLVR